VDTFNALHHQIGHYFWVDGHVIFQLFISPLFDDSLRVTTMPKGFLSSSPFLLSPLLSLSFIFLSPLFFSPLCFLLPLLSSPSLSFSLLCLSLLAPFFYSFFYWHTISIGLQNAVNAGDVNAAAVGRRIVLPSTYVSGPRYMRQLYQDAMAIVRAYESTPDYFITFTCNPKWPEITAEIFPNQTAVETEGLLHPPSSPPPLTLSTHPYYSLS
jgi:hypothetical protein